MATKGSFYGISVNRGMKVAKPSKPHVTITIRGSSVYGYEYVMESGQHSKHVSKACVGQPTETLLTGLTSAIELLKVPAVIRVVTSVKVSFFIKGKPAGSYKNLKQEIYDAVKAKKSRIYWEFKEGQAKEVRDYIRSFRPVVAKSAPKKDLCSAPESTLVPFAMPNGKVTMIPPDWNPGGPGDELAPF